MGKSALGASADVDKIRQALANVNSSGLQGVRSDLAQIAQEANNAGDEVNGFGDSLSAVAGGLLAGGGLASLISEALDVSSLNTDIDITLNLNKEDTRAVRESIREVTSAIGDQEGAYEGVRRQLTLNKDASIESNQEIITGASAIAKAYKEIDFKELIQESFEIGKELKISQKEALGLTNYLLSIGFPPEQLDIIAEYGSQLQRAGFDAEQVQGIFKAGVDTGTWNIDNLLDGLKEGRIRATEFGTELTDAQSVAIDNAGLSIAQFEKWGKAITQGGEAGNKAFVELTKALNGVDDATAKNALGVEIFGKIVPK